MADLLDMLENLDLPQLGVEAKGSHVDQRMQIDSLLLKRSPSVRSVSFAEKVQVKKLDAQMDFMDIRHGTSALDVKRELVCKGGLDSNSSLHGNHYLFLTSLILIICSLSVILIQHPHCRSLHQPLRPGGPLHRPGGLLPMAEEPEGILGQHQKTFLSMLPHRLSARQRQ